ncbi:MAG: proton-translocating NADH-quinone oxidoreductase, chain, partial [Bryobacterales bacterium]|nr:proton-translocating NADH-quinone oxidoreductase, chain [Bryobacterales bacterium]
GLPILNNFIGEFLILQGAAQANFTWAAWAALGVILSACYMLWMYQRVFYGEARTPLPDMNGREWACVVPLVVMMVWMGVYTQTFLPAISSSTSQILDESKANVPFRVQLLPNNRETARAR